MGNYGIIRTIQYNIHNESTNVFETVINITKNRQLKLYEDHFIVTKRGRSIAYPKYIENIEFLQTIARKQHVNSKLPIDQQDTMIMQQKNDDMSNYIDKFIDDHIL